MHARLLSITQILTLNLTLTIGDREVVEAAKQAVLKAAGGGGKTVCREACQFLSAGTNIAQDEDDAMQLDHQEKYMLSLIEQQASDGTVTFGVCVLDSSTSTFQVGSFVDDEYQTRLATLMSLVKGRILICCSMLLRVGRRINPDPTTAPDHATRIGKTQKA